MVRTYVRKSQRASYTKETLETALNEVRNTTMSLNRAHKVYKIPKATLSSHISGKRGQKSKSQGRAPCLPEKDEKELAECLRIMEKWGFGLSRKEVFYNLHLPT